MSQHEVTHSAQLAPQSATAIAPGSAAGNAAAPETFLHLLATTLATEYDYELQIEGQLPDTLSGTLYRNGPGRFDRGSYRKRKLLDGDGMIQSYRIDEGRVRFSNRFVRTPKLKAEERAGKLLFPTWTSRAPGGFTANFGGKIPSQAGVTIYDIDGHMLAFDEVGLPFEIDPCDLSTRGQFPIGTDGGAAIRQGKYAIKAHAKYDMQRGEWLFLGNSYGREMKLCVITRDANGRFVRSHAIKAPRNVYIHDFFATERHIVILLHPAIFSPFAFLLGLKSFTDSLDWQPRRGNKLMVIDRYEAVPPVILNTDACFMWHALNAYDQGADIIADFVGYDAPDHFIGNDPAFAAIMENRISLPRHRGRLHRYIIDTNGRKVRRETLSEVNVEFPMTRPSLACHRHRYGYTTYAADSSIFHDGIARIDTETGLTTQFSFGPDTQIGEPIFVAQPGACSNRPEQDEGWLLSVGLDGHSGRSFLAVFDAQRIDAGPVARAWLRHHLPLSFHGCWRAAP